MRLHIIKNHFKKLPFLKDVMTLASGTAVAQVIGILTIPLITRLYDPNAFGNYAAFSSTVIVLSIASAGRYDQALMLPKSAYGARVVMVLSLAISVVVCGIALIVLAIFQNQLDAIYNVSLGATWILTPVVAFLMTALQIGNMLANRSREFYRTAFARIVKSIGQSMTQLISGVSGLSNSLGLVLGDTVGVLMAVAFHWRSSRTAEYTQSASKRMRVRTLKAAASRYSEFPIFRAPTALINQLQNWLTLLIVGALFASEELGQYFLMFKVIMLPSMLMGGAVGQVYYQRATKAVRQGQLYKLTSRLVTVLAACGTTMAVILVFGGEDIFGFLFGDQWRRAGHFSTLIAPYMAAHFVLMPLGTTAIVVGRTGTAFMLTAVQNIIFVTAFWWGGFILGGIERALVSVATISTCYLLLMVVWNLRIARASSSLAKV